MTDSATDERQPHDYLARYPIMGMDHGDLALFAVHTLPRLANSLDSRQVRILRWLPADGTPRCGYEGDPAPLDLARCDPWTWCLVRLEAVPEGPGRMRKGFALTPLGQALLDELKFQGR